MKSIINIFPTGVAEVSFFEILAEEILSWEAEDAIGTEKEMEIVIEGTAPKKIAIMVNNESSTVDVSCQMSVIDKIGSDLIEAEIGSSMTFDADELSVENVTDALYTKRLKLVFTNDIEVPVDGEFDITVRVRAL